MDVIMKDTSIFETETFAVCVPDVPHIPREDGGHIWIRPKKSGIHSRLDLTPKEAIEVMRLTLLIGEAMINGMKNRDINIERINYQENGNWAYLRGEKPVFHIHLYARAKNSKTQPFGEALKFPNEDTGFYDNFQPLSADDIKEIKAQIAELQNTEKYSLIKWGLE